MDRSGALVRLGVLALALGAGNAACGSERAGAGSGLEVLVAFRKAVPLPAGARLTFHVEVPTGQRFEFPFRRLLDSEKRSAVAEAEAGRLRARRQGSAPSPAPAAGSTHAGSGSDHAGSGSAAPASAPPPPRRAVVAVDRHLGGHDIAIAALPALVNGATEGPAFIASIALLGCPEGDHYDRAAGACPRHRRPLEPGPVPAFEGAAVLETGETITNARIQFP